MAFARLFYRNALPCVQINSEEVELPYSYTSAGEPSWIVERSGNFVALTTSFGLKVAFDGEHKVEVFIPKIYAGETNFRCFFSVTLIPHTQLKDLLTKLVSKRRSQNLHCGSKS